MNTWNMSQTHSAREAFRQVGYTLQKSERGTPPVARASLTSSNSELSEGICMIPKKNLSKKSRLVCVEYFYGVLAATNLSKQSVCSSSITKIALWWILTYRTIIPVITAHISPGNQSVDQFWSSGTLGSHFYNLKYSNHHRIDRDIWKISREIW